MNICRGCGAYIERNKWCQRCRQENILYPIPNAKNKIIRRDNYRCEICGIEIGIKGEFHHIKPKSEGGSNFIENIQYLCAGCHAKITKEWRRKKSKKYIYEVKYKQLNLFDNMHIL
jgi:5-methylcytosine-specific restriction endonuclease McrA